MKKEVIALSFFALLLILIFPLVIAAEADQVSKAYECLENKIDSANCSKLSPDEKVFSLMAVEKCQSELLETSYNNTCWPGSDCNVLDTAKASFALSTVGTNTSSSEEWLLTKTKTATEVDWFLEIEPDGPTTCSLTYDDSSYTIQILENKKISGNAGKCLSLAQDDYWLQISPSCYGTEFEISCSEEGFITTLLFKKPDSSTVYVSKEVTRASAKGATKEKVVSYCFADGASCDDYESSLWAAYTLYSLDYDVKPYLPYLITMREENEYLLPEAFLNFITGEYQEELISYQIANTYWQKSGDKYYDTALAMWPFHYKKPYAWEQGKDWLLDEQEADGCWDSGNLQNTAFILYSVWPEYFSEECTTDDDCSGDQICENGYCIDPPECTTDDDCASDEICEDGYCIDIPECETDDDCEEGEVCTDGVCVEGDECTTDDDCSGDQICENGYCIDPPECETDDDCEADEICDDGYCIYYIPDEPVYCDDKYDCNSNQQCIDNECVDNEILDCEDSGYFCMSAVDCDGFILDDYSDSCFSPFKCCTVEKELDSCSEQNGEICASDEYCSGGVEVDASDIYSTESCCVGGFCKESSGGGGDSEDDCESNGGTCRVSCNSDEAESSFYDCDYGDVCCMPAKKKSTGGRILIWILMVLILLAVIGIVFRDKLRTLWMKLKSKFKKGKKKKPEHFPSIMHPRPSSGRPIPRRILPRRPLSSERPTPSKPEPKHKGELDDILKKLKDIGK